MKFKKLFIKYPVPIKNDQELNSYALLWPNQQINLKLKDKYFEEASLKDKKNFFKDSRIKLLYSFSSNGLIGVASELKYKNTLDFFDYVAKTFTK